MRKDGEGEHHAREAHIDLGDFEAADFGGDGVVIELAQESAELFRPRESSERFGYVTASSRGVATQRQSDRFARLADVLSS